MKIIDLLNKIANGENISNNHMKYFDRQDQEYDICLICLSNLTYKLDNDIIELNDEVEIIEEEKKIPEKSKIDFNTKLPVSGCSENEAFMMTCISHLGNTMDKVIDYLESKGE